MKRTLTVASVLLCWLAPAAAANVTARRGPVSKAGKVLDPCAVWLENDLLKLAVTTNRYAGQVMSFVYKPMGVDLAAAEHDQGYCTDRMGEDRFFWSRKSRDYGGEIVSQSEGEAAARVAYVWDYDYNDAKTTVRVTKTFRLPAGEAVLWVTWRLENVGETAAQMTPWVKHLGRRGEKVLAGPTVMLLPAGPRDPGGEFVKPATDWVARLSGTETTDKLPMVASVMDYAKIFQQFPWRGKVRFTLETVLNRTVLEPGKSWQVTYALAAMANLARPWYVAPELAAEAELTDGRIEVSISPAKALGERRIEGELLDGEGGLIAKLPNRQASLVPGKIARLSYDAQPPGDGVYTLSLSVFDDRQQIIRLGRGVNSRQASITLPVVVGQPPEKVVEPWQAEGFSWPRRKGRDVEPLRVLLAGDRLRAAQLAVPRRIFPEDRIACRAAPESARIRLAKGEYEDLQVAVDFARGRDVFDLDVRLEPPTRNGRALASADLREAIYVTTETPSSYKDFPVGEYPDPLFPLGWQRMIPDAPVTRRNVKVMTESKRRVFWLIVRAGRDAPAGVYRGALSLSLPDGPAAKIPVEVEVLDFALPKRPALRCSTNMVGFSGRKWRSNLRIMGLGDDRIEAIQSERDVFDRYRRLVLGYGWTPTMYFGPEQWKRYYDFGRGVNVFPINRPDAEAEAWLKDKGLLDYAFVYAPFDEHADVEVPQVVAWAKKWKAGSDIPILDCFYGKNVQPLFGLVDIWLGQGTDQPWVAARRKAGDLFFACNSSLIWHIEYAPVQGRAQFWQDFADGVDGRYVYSTIRWTEDVYRKNWTSGNYMGCAVYPSPDGICPSIRLETLRDGVEDYDYLALLRRAGGGKEIEAFLKRVDAGKVGTVEKLRAARNRLADWLDSRK